MNHWKEGMRDRWEEEEGNPMEGRWRTEQQTKYRISFNDGIGGGDVQRRGTGPSSGTSWSS